MTLIFLKLTRSAIINSMETVIGEKKICLFITTKAYLKYVLCNISASLTDTFLVGSMMVECVFGERFMI